MIMELSDSKAFYEMWLDAVKQNGLELNYVPNHHKTYELCFEAVKKVVML